MNLAGARLSVELPALSICAIVQFRSDLVYGKDIPQMPAVMCQVTVRPDKISPSRDLIRFGDTQGDELVGWMRRDYLQVVEVLGTVDVETGKVSPIVPLTEALAA